MESKESNINVLGRDDSYTITNPVGIETNKWNPRIMLCAAY
ncbi:hypothetical protein [Pleomorphovibrio marinus]|nr:hypothetical protein [Pleomorphovibrio marinus]